MTTLIGADGQRIEISPGRGDLRLSSVPSVWGADGAFMRGQPISFAQMFATQQWVAIAVMRLLTWSVRVPLKVYRRIDDDKIQRLTPADHPLARAVAEPWDRGTMAELVTSLLGPLLVHGNDLTDVEQGANDRIRFEPLDWRHVMPVPEDANDPNSEIVAWNDYLIGGGKTRSSDTVMHLRWWSPLGRLGVSPLQQIRDTIVGEKAAINWTLQNLAQGVRPSGIVETSDEFLGVEPGQRQQMLDQAREDIHGAYAGPDKAGIIPVLPPGLKWTTAEHTTAVEAELMAQRQVHRNEVAAIYMVPPPMIGQLDKATYSNIATQREMAYTDGLAPPLVMIEQKVNAHIVRGLLREDDIYVEFDFGPILRGDRLKEIQALREAIGSALLTPNEGRAVMNLTKADTPNADKLWMPLNNLKPIDSQIPPPKGARGGETASLPAPTVNGAH